MQSRSYAFGKNHWTIDPDLPVLLSTYWPDARHHTDAFTQFGGIAGGKAYEIAYQIDRSAAPVLIMHDVNGQRIDRVHLNVAHAELLHTIAYINRPPYEGGTWMQHFTYGYLLADPGLYCSLIVTNQTAYIIYKYAAEHKQWLEPLLSGQQWGATWMTEIQGGSDLGRNETVATQQGNTWFLDGDKYFTSNVGLTDLAVVSARPAGAMDGPKGIAVYLVPRINAQGNLNYHVRRLKEKSATRAVPSGEVEFHHSEALPVGDPKLGIYYTLEMLTVSRLANAAGAMGVARKAQIEAVGRALHRQAFGRTIIDHPLMRRDLTDIAVRNAAGLALMMRTIAAFDRCWHETPPYSSNYHYTRFLSHLMKNRTADHAAAVTQMAMEIFGGIGFLDEYAVARWHREALITPIWEGTSNIQALDMLEAMQKKHAHEEFQAEMTQYLAAANTPIALHMQQRLAAVLADAAALSSEDAQWHGKMLLTQLADIAQVALLYHSAGIGGERYTLLAELYARRFVLHEEYPEWAMQHEEIWCPPDMKAALSD